MSLFLFTAPGLPPLPGSSPGFSMDGEPGLGGATISGPEPDRAPEPFSGAMAKWPALRGVVVAVVGATEGARGAIGQSGADSPFHEMFRTWNTLAETAAQWSTIREALTGLGQDIIRYAGTVPDRYRALAAFFEEGQDHPLSPDSATRCRALLDAIVTEAEARVASAHELSTRIEPLLEALSVFADTFRREVRNPDIRIELPDTYSLCLSYDDDGKAVAGDPANGPARQLWRVEPDEDSGAHTIRTTDGTRAMVTHTAAEVIEMLQRQMREAAMGAMSFSRPQPYLAPVDVVGRSSAGLFDLNRTGSGYIVPRDWPGYTFDCAGNSGWAQGTAILNWEQNGGNNQHWRCLPSPRLASELRFYDLAAPIIHALDLSAFGRLEGEWRAIAEELKDGVADTLRSIDANEPLIASLSVEQTIIAWSDLATRAGEAIADL
jgi:hypothetical protein